MVGKRGKKARKGQKGPMGMRIKGAIRLSELS